MCVCGSEWRENAPQSTPSNQPKIGMVCHTCLIGGYPWKGPSYSQIIRCAFRVEFCSVPQPPSRDLQTCDESNLNRFQFPRYRPPQRSISSLLCTNVLVCAIASWFFQPAGRSRFVFHNKMAFVFVLLCCVGARKPEAKGPKDDRSSRSAERS